MPDDEELSTSVLDQIQQLLAAAMPGEWRLDGTRRPIEIDMLQRQSFIEVYVYDGTADLICLLHNNAAELVSLARDGLRYRHVLEHEPVMLEEIEYLIHSRAERNDEWVNKKAKPMMVVEHIISSPESQLLFGPKHDYYVIAGPKEKINVGDTIEYVPYGAAHWGTFSAVVAAADEHGKDVKS